MKRLFLLTILGFGVVAAMVLFGQAPPATVNGAPFKSAVTNVKTAPGVTATVQANGDVNVAPTPPTPVPPPSIPDDHKIAFLKARLAMTRIVETLSQDCGANFLVQVDQDDNLACVQKFNPPAPKPQPVVPTPPGPKH